MAFICFFFLSFPFFLLSVYVSLSPPPSFFALICLLFSSSSSLFFFDTIEFFNFESYILLNKIFFSFTVVGFFSLCSLLILHAYVLYIECTSLVSQLFKSSQTGFA